MIDFSFFLEKISIKEKKKKKRETEFLLYLKIYIPVNNRNDNFSVKACSYRFFFGIHLPHTILVYTNI